MKFCVQVSVLTCFQFSGVYRGAELLCLITVFVFEELPSCFPERLSIFYSHQQCVRVTVSPHPCQLWLLSSFFLWFSHPTECEVAFYCDFDLHFHSD